MTLGVLDWGVGGLFAAQHARRLQPDLDMIYLSDAGNVPYGKQDRRALARSVEAAVARLVVLGADVVLVACHSGSTALPDIIAEGPVHGVIAPWAVPVAPVTALLGGARTVQSGAWRRALADRPLLIQRIAQPLSAHVEAGRGEGTACVADLDRILRPVRAADVVVLACTHYASLTPLIQARVPRAALVDPALAVVERLTLAPGAGTLRLFTTGDPQAMRRAARRATGWDLTQISRV